MSREFARCKLPVAILRRHAARLLRGESGAQIIDIVSWGARRRKANRKLAGSALAVPGFSEAPYSISGS